MLFLVVGLCATSSNALCMRPASLVNANLAYERYLKLRCPQQIIVPAPLSANLPERVNAHDYHPFPITQSVQEPSFSTTVSVLPKGSVILGSSSTTTNYGSSNTILGSPLGSDNTDDTSSSTKAAQWWSGAQQESYFWPVVAVIIIVLCGGTLGCCVWCCKRHQRRLAQLTIFGGRTRVPEPLPAANLTQIGLTQICLGGRSCTHPKCGCPTPCVSVATCPTPVCNCSLQNTATNATVAVGASMV